MKRLGVASYLRCIDRFNEVIEKLQGRRTDSFSKITLLNFFRQDNQLHHHQQMRTTALPKEDN